MVHIISNGVGRSYGIKMYLLDKESDIADLPRKVHAGCKAFCVENSKFYIINSAGKWIEVSFGEGSSSSTGGNGSAGSDDSDEEYHIIYDGGEEV